MQEIDLIRIVIALVFFTYASLSDWKTRKVKDRTWLILGTIAFALLALDLYQRETSLMIFFMLLPIAFLFYDIFWDRDHGLNTKIGTLAMAIYAFCFIFVGYFAYSIVDGAVSWTDESSGILIAFVIIVIFELFYIFDIIKGGADAKAVITLAILVPWYPIISSNIPMILPSITDIITFFPFALSVLFVAALMSAIIPVYFLIKNISAGKKISGRAFIGFTMPIDQVEKSFVWLIEWVEEGKLRFSARRPRDTETLYEDLLALKNLGKKEVWVTNKIPFIIPMTFSLIFVIIIGNPLFALY